MPASGFSFKSEKKGDGAANSNNPQQRRDPYEVLGVARNSTDQEIKSAYRKMALKYHPDKNQNDPIASDTFKEVTFSYNILSDPVRRHQYDTSGFEAIELESQELELDLSNLGTVNTMFAALFSKLGVPIKTTVSATVLEEALHGTLSVRQLQLGQSLHKKVEKQCAHFYSVDITEEEAKTGIVCLVHSTAKSKFKYTSFLHATILSAMDQSVEQPEMDPSLAMESSFDELKWDKHSSQAHHVLKWDKTLRWPVRWGKVFAEMQLLYFEQENNGGLSLALQEDSSKTGKLTSAGMFFLGFPVYRFDQTNSMTVSKDPDTAFFKKLEGFQPCEINELKAGTHIFAIYGDNFFKSAYYTIEIVCAEPFSTEKDKLRDVEARILTKRAELSKFEMEYKEVLAQFTEMTSRYAQEMQMIDELLKERNDIHASYTRKSPLKQSSSSTRVRTFLRASRGEEEDGQSKEKRSRDRLKKRWFNIHLKVDKKKTC